jgi:Ser/Thr protein kinase RdoA (MazF antagonist)
MLPPEGVAAHLRAHWGLVGQLSALTSERDQNFRLTTADGSYVVKIANAVEPHAMTRFQNRALRHVAGRDAALPVPRVCATRPGADDVLLPEGHLMRVLAWLEGVPLHQTRPSRVQSVGLARMAAGLTRALEGFADPAADHVLQWDIKRAADLRPLLPHVADTGLRGLCAAVLDRFDTVVAPALLDLPWQVVHGDLNPHNLLADPGDSDRIAGILDFGDMVLTPRICDLAVAASYRIEGDDPVGSLAAFAGAYHAVLPLTGAERRVLFDLVAARMVTTVAITSWRAAKYPENAAYILRNVPSARVGLQAFAMADRDHVNRVLAQACPEEDMT